LNSDIHDSWMKELMFGFVLLGTTGSNINGRGVNFWNMTFENNSDKDSVNFIKEFVV
jgi:hypothetical protein